VSGAGRDLLGSGLGALGRGPYGLACHAPFHKTDFLDGKPVGTIPPVRAAGLAVVLAVAAGAALWRAFARRRTIPRRVALLAEAIPEALGDAVLALDGAGRVGHANSAAGRLVGIPVPELVDRDVAAVVPELAVLARGAGRGPASARIQVPGPRGPSRVRAVVIRVATRPPWDLAVLRPFPVARPRPPPLPRAPPAPWPAWGEARAGLAAAAAALREPVARAAGSISILRLAAPALGAPGAAALAEAEAALEVADRRVAALAAAGEGGVRRVVDLAAVAADLVARLPPVRGVRVRITRGDGARALADDRPVRAALRELLAAAAGAAGAVGGELLVTVRAGPTSSFIEVRSPARVPAGGLSLVRALLAPQGGRVEEEPEPGYGGVVRIGLERAASLEPA
jgi:hypothetical protein